MTTSMTIDEARDYIAKCKGWTLGTDPKWIGTSGFIVWQRDGVQHPSLGHPIPATLDAAHDSLPEGYWFWVNYCSLNGVDTYVCQLVGKRIPNRIEADAPTMLLAMFRASAAAWAQVKGEVQ